MAALLTVIIGVPPKNTKWATMDDNVTTTTTTTTTLPTTTTLTFDPTTTSSGTDDFWRTWGVYEMSLAFLSISYILMAITTTVMSIVLCCRESDRITPSGCCKKTSADGRVHIGNTTVTVGNRCCLPKLGHRHNRRCCCCCQCKRPSTKPRYRVTASPNNNKPPKVVLDGDNSSDTDFDVDPLSKLESNNLASFPGY